MECISPRYLAKQDITVPCGNCAFCGSTRRSDWATRLHYESKMHLDKKFVTLTYNDKHLRWKDGVSQLCKEDLQKWFKRVRRTGAKIRYYAVGEYGSKTFRPHYHVLLFGEVSEETLRKCWSDDKGHPIGHIHVGQVTQASIMYSLGYIINGKGWKMRTKRTPPFSLMSRRPGLGANYLTKEMVAWHQSARRNYTVLDGERRHLPRYYKGKIFSKLDHVRIAVQAQKDAFNALVKWIRSPPMMRMKDPLSYRKEQLLRLQKLIRSKSKEYEQI